MVDMTYQRYEVQPVNGRVGQYARCASYDEAVMLARQRALNGEPSHVLEQSDALTPAYVLATFQTPEGR